MTKNRDLQIALYFNPTDILPTIQDEKMFVEWSSQGKHKEKVKMSHFHDGFNALVYGKRRAGLQMRLNEEGVLEGTMPYYTLLVEEKPPRYVVDFMKREMFKGIDAELIERVYSA